MPARPVRAPPSCGRDAAAARLRPPRILATSAIRQGNRTSPSKRTRMAMFSRQLRRPSVRSTLVGTSLLGLVAGGSIAIGASLGGNPARNDIGWMLAEHPAADPTFDGARNLHLAHTPQAKCGPG